jgi:hypothetical protein
MVICYGLCSRVKLHPTVPVSNRPYPALYCLDFLSTAKRPAISDRATPNGNASKLGSVLGNTNTFPWKCFTINKKDRCRRNHLLICSNNRTTQAQMAPIQIRLLATCSSRTQITTPPQSEFDEIRPDPEIPSQGRVSTGNTVTDWTGLSFEENGRLYQGYMPTGTE